MMCWVEWDKWGKVDKLGNVGCGVEWDGMGEVEWDKWSRVGWVGNSGISVVYRNKWGRTE